MKNQKRVNKMNSVTSRVLGMGLTLMWGLLAAMTPIANAATYTYTPTNTATESWSDGANWSAVPVSAADTILTFMGTNSTVLPNSTANFNNNDVANPFNLNVLNLQGTGPASGAGYVTIGGTALQFVNNGSSNPVMNLNALAGTAGLNYTNNAQITLATNITVTGDGTAGFVLGGAITGSGAITKYGASTLQLNGDSSGTFSGPINIRGGVVKLNVSLGGRLPTSQVLNFDGPGGQFAYGFTSGHGNARLDEVNAIRGQATFGIASATAAYNILTNAVINRSPGATIAFGAGTGSAGYWRYTIPGQAAGFMSGAIGFGITFAQYDTVNQTANVITYGTTPNTVALSGNLTTLGANTGKHIQYTATAGTATTASGATSGSTSLTVASAASFAVGSYAFGVGIPPDIKHPNALRYECAAMMAFGAKCSVGDQLHPDGQLDESTYGIIGAAYAEVEAKEPWCEGSRNVADVGIISSQALDPLHQIGEDSDVGATRLLLEGQILFDMLDAEMDFSPYKVIMVLDEGRVDSALKSKLDAYLAKGGKVLFTGRSALGADGKPLFNVGAEVAKESEFSLDYILPIPELRPSFADSPLIMYCRYPRLKVTTGTALGEVVEPYFERAWNHFCSHQHAPQKRQGTGLACGVQQGNLLWLPMDLCLAYRKWGQVTTKHFFLACLRRLLGEGIGLKSNLPATARVTLTEQPAAKRHVLHLLHANLVQRGALQQTHMGQMMMEVVEDLTPCCDVKLSLRLDKPAKRVTLEPQGQEIPFRMKDGRLELELDRFTCHQMVVIQ
jgi:hypothetical protein